jgi:predicted dehydrogenase
MRLGKHVYCEKPLTWSIEEARLMASTAKKMKVATQMGTQGMAQDGARAGVEVVRSGVSGIARGARSLKI